MREPFLYASRLDAVHRELAAANKDGETDLEVGLVIALKAQFECAARLSKAAHVSTWTVLKLAAKHSPKAQAMYDEMAKNDVT